MNQSALSQTVRTLERHPGGQLLIRDHAGARPTDLGFDTALAVEEAIGVVLTRARSGQISQVERASLRWRDGPVCACPCHALSEVQA